MPFIGKMNGTGYHQVVLNKTRLKKINILSPTWTHTHTQIDQLSKTSFIISVLMIFIYYQCFCDTFIFPLCDSVQLLDIQNSFVHKFPHLVNIILEIKSLNLNWKILIFLKNLL